MKRGNIIFFVILFFLVVIIFFLEFKEVKVDLISSRIVQYVGINISVLVSPPSLTIEKPRNQTYFNNISLELRIDSDDADNLFYNLDEEANVTFTGSRAYFNVSAGGHTIYIFANNSGGTTKKNVTFSVNTTLYTVNFSFFTGTGKNSTNFNIHSFEELQNLTGIFFEDLSDGKISFDDIINLTDDESPNDGLINLNFINISFNRIELNATALPNFNKSAVLRLYSLTFTSPRILFDGEVCPSDICKQNSYSGGELSFNVTHFTVYSAEETPADDSGGGSAGGGGGSAGGGGGGGGGGSRTQVKELINIIPDKLSLKIKQGQTKRAEMVFYNSGTKKVNVILELAGLGDLAILRQKEFTLDVGQSERVIIDFISPEDFKPDVYLGKIIAKTSEMQKEILIALDISSKSALFDIEVKIPERSSLIAAGDYLIAEINLFNLGEIGRIDTELEYFIKNQRGEIVLHKKETLAVETKISLIKEFLIPDDLEIGDYVLNVKSTYEENAASASAWFKIERKSLLERKGYLQTATLISATLIIILLIIIITISVINYRRVSGHLKEYHKVETKDLIKDEGLVKSEKENKVRNIP